MENVINVEFRRKKYNETISRITLLLKQAEAGEIDGLIYCAKTKDSQCKIGAVGELSDYPQVTKAIIDSLT